MSSTFRFKSLPQVLQTIAFSALAIALAMTAQAEQANSEPLAGFIQTKIKVAYRAWSIPTSIWYPAEGQAAEHIVGQNFVFEGTPVLDQTQIKQGKFPLFVFSHGSGSNMESMGWLASELVKSGAMVVAVNHPGSTSNDSSPRRSARFWERPQDLSAALDHVLADPVYGPHVDQSRIYTLGFSLGGMAVLQTIGARMDRDVYADYCAGAPDAPDCLFFGKGNVDFRLLDQGKFNASYEDPRLAGTIAIDPGMVAGMTPASISSIEKPVLLINLGTDDTLWPTINIGQSGLDLETRMVNATYVQIAPADHYSFLPECTENAPAMLMEEGEDPICDDPEGSDRADVHRQVIDAVRNFMDLGTDSPW
ncbi:alpha/beta hydrolase family protein [Roseibium algae]|uniref:Dienelactone hydrolase n=1 Tax=Roseibium algae TaxID=3123038 RepID=A0ABU8TIP7_9HYPH